MKKDQTNKIITKAWNPFTGCTKISPACKNCYAEPMAEKLHCWGTAGYDNIFKFTKHPDRISKSDPLHKKKPTLYFINNMSDTFHEDADIESIDKIINIDSMAFWHNFYLLTKISKRMKEYFKDKDIPNNFWLGVTVEDKKHGLPRVKDLQKINCKNKHICCEPLVEDLGEFDLSGISLVVGGGESGKNARRCEPTWVESLKNQCELQNVHFYWKQWGTFGEDGVRRSKDKNGCLINGKEYLSFPDNIMP